MKYTLCIPCELHEQPDEKRNKNNRRLKQKKNVRRIGADYQDNHTTPMLLSFSQERFARELAYAMDDLKSLLQYRKWVRDHSAEVLAEIMEKVLARQDVRNRGAYFTSLVKQHEYNIKRDARG